MTAAENITRKCTSWIDQFVEYTEGIPSPEPFRRWAAISVVSAAMERKCWIAPGDNILYPNLFVFLVAPPGVGKTQAINHAISLARQTEEIRIAPDDSTKAALVDYLSEESRKRVTLSGELYEYNSVLSAAHELGVLIKEHDLEFINFLSALYDNPDLHEERRRHRKEQQLLRIIRPGLSFLAGATPGYLSSLFPEVAWTQGFMARVLCIYSADAIRPTLFGKRKSDPGLGKRLLHDLLQICKLQGEFSWTDGAQSKISEWYESGCKPAPTHYRLLNYIPRRHLHALKLCMVNSAARSNSMEITEADVDEAISRLLIAERAMPEIFLEMAQNTDSHIVKQLHFQLTKMYAGNHKAIHQSRIYQFLGHYAPAWKAKSIFDYMIDSKIILPDTQNPDYFIPHSGVQTGGEL